ncbi:PAS domain S-box-containing protein/diguanylate cyclase (GGDEF) domain-containing protein [Desulfonispora thiosulfatigenes DSM 11270]|uniref:PAS domain S-box-containing protein/diguanylate cyclase (GGDEF) domain-containing protein n=1 Tax=Desulfonispora thiosulfatigenes DSM 11270 TaxID=656914 RepID=A0A1W1UIJ3_DESTI|nr:GGDEF domain-containing protein [Desulfonispora thiosulfatigenes]SMB80928.1 PAS domain S-box-containing protein/diguanylate cyclase (GGDEF) domain-containing protein [Desulfonispora thiosulfatigenes DSM 11270]
MDYSKLTKDQLIQIIEEVKLLNEVLLKEKEQEVKLKFPWTGNLGHWYWNVKANIVTCNALKITTLNYSKDEIPERMGYEFFTDKIHPDDYQNVMNCMISHLSGETDVYEVEYRIKTKQGCYKWYYDRGKITRYDELGKPIFLSGIVFDVTEKKEAEFKLMEINRMLYTKVNNDGLTNLNRREVLMEHLKAEIDKVLKCPKPLAIAILDIDNFKKINDTKGHVFGDRVLKEIGNIIKQEVRDTDFVGRYGGEEFIIVYSNTYLKDAITVSERIRKSIENHYFEDGYNVTTSGGVYQYQGESLEEFIKRADENLYKAKVNGKNRII